MKKNLGIIITFAIVAILAITVVVMALVQVNYKPEIASPNSITIKNSSSKTVYITSSNNNFDKIIDEFEKSFTTNYLSAFFAGQTSNNIVVKQTSTAPTTTGYKVSMNYSEAQNLVVNNETQTHKYNEIIFGVTDTSNFSKVSIYFKQASSSSQYYYYETFMTQSSLYELIDGFDFI